MYHLYVLMVFTWETHTRKLLHVRNVFCYLHSIGNAWWNGMRFIHLPCLGVWISTSVAESRTILSPPFIVAFHFSHTSYQGHRSILFNTILYSHKFRSDRQTFDGAYKAAVSGITPTWQTYTVQMAKWQMPSIEWNLFVACHSATRKFTVTILCTRGRLRLCNFIVWNSNEEKKENITRKYLKNFHSEK